MTYELCITDSKLEELKEEIQEKMLNNGDMKTPIKLPANLLVAMIEYIQLSRNLTIELDKLSRG